jgi:hypothetical protein
VIGSHAFLRRTDFYRTFGLSSDNWIALELFLGCGLLWFFHRSIHKDEAEPHWIFRFGFSQDLDQKTFLFRMVWFSLDTWILLLRIWIGFQPGYWIVLFNQLLVQKYTPE